VEPAARPLIGYVKSGDISLHPTVVSPHRILGIQAEEPDRLRLQEQGRGVLSLDFAFTPGVQPFHPLPTTRNPVDPIGTES